GGNGLHDHRGHVLAAQRLLHRGQVVERHVAELVRPVGEEQGGEPLVPRGGGEAGGPGGGLGDRDDLAALGGVACRLERDVDRLAAAAAEDHLRDPGGPVLTSASDSAVRASEGKWWLPMSKCCIAAVTAATTSGLR